MPLAPRWLGWIWLVSGILGLIAAAVVAVFGAAFVSSTSESVRDALGVTENLLVTVRDTAGTIDSTLTGVDEGLETVQRSVGDAAVTLTQLGRVADELGAVATITIPESLDELRSGMPQLIATAGVIDGAMRALRFVGVDYDPNEPLDDGLRELDSQLAGIPVELRDQADAVSEVSEGIADFGGEALGVAADIGAIQDRMASAGEVITEYTEVANHALAVVDGARDRLTAQADAARIAVLVLGIAIAAGQTVPIAFGWWIIRPGRHAG